MLTRALGLRAGGTTPFTDVKATDWFAHSVAAAYEAGLIKGVGNDQFDPNALISRQDLAVILPKAMSLLQVTGKSSSQLEAYTDVLKISVYAQASVKAVSANELMDITIDDGSFKFNPLDSASREAAASAIFLLLQKTGLIN